MSLDLQAKLGIFFAVGGIIAGLICAPLSGRLALVSLLVLFFSFYVCYRFAPKILKFQASQVTGGWSIGTAFKKYFDLFFFLWLVFWILSYTDLLRL
jgi:hypothetical protein